MIEIQAAFLHGQYAMIEKPPSPDLPRSPEPIDKPSPDIKPIPPPDIPPPAGPPEIPNHPERGEGSPAL